MPSPPQSTATSFTLSDRVNANPTHIWIEPTNRCNTRCTHCGHFYEKFGEDMSTPLFEKIRNSALDGVQRVELIGYGEPLMARQFEAMMDECLRRDLEIYTTTNGILLANDKLVAKLVRSPMRLCLSLDGARAETFEFVRPYIKWGKMIEVLECIKRNADDAGVERKFSLRINYVAMKHSISDLPEMVRLASRYGASQIYVLPLGGDESFEKVKGQSLDASPELVSPSFLAALRLAARLRVEIIVPPSFVPLILDGAERGRGLRGKVMRTWRKAELGLIYLRTKGLRGVLRKIFSKPSLRAKAGISYCTMPWKDAYFASDGTVYPCCVMTEKLGDLAKQSWEEIWNGPLYRNLRRTVHSWNPSAVCRFCTLSHGINGGDERQYGKYFSRFRVEALALDSRELDFVEGAHPLETTPEGKASHFWLRRRARFSIPFRKGAKFVRFLIVARQPVPVINPGWCRINGGPAEPFDNSCGDITFPVAGKRNGRLQIEIEMENEHRVEGDPRDLALAIRGVEFLL